MVRANTARIVTVMADKQPYRDIPEMQVPRESVCVDSATAVPRKRQHSVATRECSPLPFPARSTFEYAAPESINHRYCAGFSISPVALPRTESAGFIRQFRGVGAEHHSAVFASAFDLGHSKGRGPATAAAESCVASSDVMLPGVEQPATRFTVASNNVIRGRIGTHCGASFRGVTPVAVDAAHRLYDASILPVSLSTSRNGDV